MTNNIKYLKDESGSVISPVVSADSVYVDGTNQSLTKSFTFSTSPVKTGMTWINGKPIYSIVINFRTGTAMSTWQKIATLSDATEVIGGFHHVKDETYHVDYHNNTTGTNSYFCFNFNTSTKEIEFMYTAEFFGNRNSVLILWYY